MLRITTKALTKLAACYLALDRPERAEGPIDEALRLAHAISLKHGINEVWFTCMGED